MNAQQKTAYFASLAELERALVGVQRCAVVSQVGLGYVVSLNTLHKNLQREVEDARVERPRLAPKPQPAMRDTSPMRPNYRGD